MTPHIIFAPHPEWSETPSSWWIGVNPSKIATELCNPNWDIHNGVPPTWPKVLHCWISMSIQNAGADLCEFPIGRPGDTTWENLFVSRHRLFRSNKPSFRPSFLNLLWQATTDQSSKRLHSLLWMKVTNPLIYPGASPVFYGPQSFSALRITPQRGVQLRFLPGLSSSRYGWPMGSYLFVMSL